MNDSVSLFEDDDDNIKETGRGYGIKELRETDAYLGIHYEVVNEIAHAYSNNVEYVYVERAHPLDIGRFLLDNLNDKASIHHLLEYGDMLSVNKDGAVFFDSDDEDGFYDGGNWVAQVSSDVDAVVENAKVDDIHFVYIWDVSGWKVARVNGSDPKFDFMSLEEAMNVVSPDEDWRW